MGASCSHSRLNPVNIYEGKHSSCLLWKYKSAEVECQDCGRKFNAIQHTGKISGHEGAWKIVNTSTCDHCDIDVDESTTVIKREPSLLGGFASLFVRDFFGDITYDEYYSAKAHCFKCRKEFEAKACLNEEWRNKKIVKVRTTDWRIIKDPKKK